METGKDLAAKQILKVTYSVRFADESLAGKTVKNTAVISSDNMDPVDADHGVTVNPKEEEKPALSIDKNVNLSSASVGDTLSYTLTVKETEKDQTAKNVVVRDNFDTTGMKVGGIQATLDGKRSKEEGVTFVTEEESSNPIRCAALKRELGVSSTIVYK